MLSWCWSVRFTLQYLRRIDGVRNSYTDRIHNVLFCSFRTLVNVSTIIIIYDYNWNIFEILRFSIKYFRYILLLISMLRSCTIAHDERMCCFVFFSACLKLYFNYQHNSCHQGERKYKVFKPYWSVLWYYKYTAHLVLAYSE